MTKRRGPCGNALGGTLLVMVLLFIFGLTLANMATFDLRLVNRTGERMAAREAAEAGINHVMALIGQDPTVGTNNEVFQQTLPDGSSYRISFDNDEADWSLNNLSSLTRNPGSHGRQVPPNHCLIFSQGRSKAGEIALVETLIRLEALPYAIAGSGKVKSGALGNVQVYGALTGGGTADLMANTYSGSLDADSTRFGAGSRIRGDVHSAGGAQLSGVTVDGDTETNHDPVQLPNLNITDFDPDVTGAPYNTVNPGLLSGLVLSNTCRIDGEADFLLVTLNDATVYVNGNLNVTALVGSGAIFVNGTTTFTAPITFSGPDRITLFSEGDINVGLLGIFQGVLMTHGNFNSSGALTVLGAIYANNPADSSKGNVNFNGLLSLTNVTHVEEYTAFASFWLAMGGEAEPVQVYWNQLR